MYFLFNSYIGQMYFPEYRVEHRTLKRFDSQEI